MQMIFWRAFPRGDYSCDAYAQYSARSAHVRVRVESPETHAVRKKAREVTLGTPLLY
jgi:hypothetical protein